VPEVVAQEPDSAVLVVGLKDYWGKGTFFIDEVCHVLLVLDCTAHLLVVLPHVLLLLFCLH
jgi:hypothetical protein